MPISKIQQDGSVRMTGLLPLRQYYRSAGLRHQLHGVIQLRAPEHGHGRHHPETAVVHGRVSLLLDLPEKGELPVLLAGSNSNTNDFARVNARFLFCLYF